jgi:prophage regulatory protein
MAVLVQPVPTILRRKQVEARTGFSRSTLYAKLNKNSSSFDSTFPRPIRLTGTGPGRGAVGWLAHEIDAWIMSRIEVSRPL